MGWDILSPTTEVKRENDVVALVGGFPQCNPAWAGGLGWGKDGAMAEFGARILGLALLVGLVACGGSRDRTSSTNPRDIGPRVDAGFAVDGAALPDGSSQHDGAIDDDSGTPGDGAVGDTGVGPAPDGGTGDAGCLTFAQASQVCGTAAPETVCNFAVSCELSTSLSQCQINCEMGATVTCYTPSTVACVASALQTSNCSALSTCGVIW